MNAIFLALAYLRFHWLRSGVLVLVAALILAVPLISQTLLEGARNTLTDRAEATPLVLGNRGSQLDLVMSTLYFSDERANPVTMAAGEAIWDSGLAVPIPLNTAFETGGARIVGTSLDYFDFRGLVLAEGRQLAILGEAVIGATVAERLGLGPGDTLVSAPQNLFDLDGVYPLELNIVGVFAPSGTPDDEAVFVDVATTWVIAGIGHGHEGVFAPDADTGDVVASAAIVEFNRITPDNIDSFHFHGDPDSYPISGLLVVPSNERDATILRGRYLDADNPLQMIVPEDVVSELVARIFRIKAVLDAVTLIVGVAAFAAIALAVFLSYRLRAREMQTAYKLGARRGIILQLLASETMILLGIAALLAMGLVAVVQSQGEGLVAWILAT
ncbi:MAG: ABC transporter permease [Pseudomonadota bacterium]